MSMRQMLPALMLAILMAIPAMSAKAYQYTGAVKTLEAGGWKHWQEIKLQKGDDSVWSPCRRFTRQLQTMTVSPISFTVEDCVDVSEQLSGVSEDQHDRLPIGTALWVPYVPFDVTVTSADVSALQFDPTALEEALATVQATMLSEDEIVLLSSNSTSTLERALMQQIQQLRTELSSEQSSNKQMLLARLTALAAAAENGQPIPETNAVATGSITEGLAALTDQVNDLVDLHTELSAMEQRLGQVETDLQQVQTNLANKADKQDIIDLDGRLLELEQDTTAADLTSRVEGLENDTSVSDLADRVQTLEEKPQTDGEAEDISANWYWWLITLTSAVLVLFVLIGGLLSRTKKTGDTVKDHGRRITDVEKIVNYIVTYNAQQRFACPELTDDRLNDLPVGESIELIVKEQGTGAAHPHVHLTKGKNPDGSEYLQLVGIKDSAAERLSPKQLKGRNESRFTVIRVFKKLGDAIKNDRVIGVGKDPAYKQ